jgi:hypothetical protein
MKTIVNKFFVLVTYMLGFVNVFAAPDPPMPNGKGLAPPPPPGLPIDENLPFLILIAILFGMYVIYNQTLKTKNSIPI